MHKELATPTPFPLPRRSAIILAGVVVGLLALGSVADYAISEQLYSPGNTFGTVLAAYGETPALLALVAAGTLALIARPPVHMVLRWLLVLGGAALIVVGTTVTITRPEEFWDISLLLRAPIGIALGAGTIWATIHLARGATWQAACMVAALFVIVVGVEMVLIQGVKTVWERPRMRMLTDTGADFSPWWSPGFPEKEALIATGVDAKEFTSFPSGHTGNAAAAMVFTAVALLREDLRRWAPVALWAGAAWAGVVGLSRITLGAHFLTDTTAAFAVTFAALVVVSLLAVKVLRSGVLTRLESGAGTTTGPRHGRSAH